MSKRGYNRSGTGRIDRETESYRRRYNGILVQLPLPAHIDEDRIIRTISPDKDVDGFHPVNVGRLWLGETGFVSCTPAGIIQLLKYSGIEIAGKSAW